MNYPTPIRPSWWYYLLAIPSFLIGAGLFVYFLWTGVKSATADLTQVVVPGEADLTLAKPGTYTIFIENPSEVNGKAYSSSESVAELTCKVTAPRTDSSTNEAVQRGVALRHTNVNTTYTVSNRAGRSVFEFQAEDASIYHLQCAYPKGKSGPEAVMAVGAGVTGKILKTLMRSFWGIFVGLALAGAVIITITVKRDKMRRALLLGMAHANQMRIAGQYPAPQ